MKSRISLYMFTVFVLMLSAVPRGEGQLFGQAASPEQIVVAATNVLTQSVAESSGIPQKMLAEARGIVIAPNMVRGAFILGMQHGRGVLLTRDAQGAWQPPRSVQITGGSLGYQIGVQSTDLILVFRTPQSVANLLKGTIKIGLDASAAAGPVGRQTSAATDLALQAEILSYSRARGAFVGVSIDGSSISLDQAADALYYQPPGTVPPSATQLIQTVMTYSSSNSTTVPPPGLVPTPDPITAPTTEFEAARQQLDAVSRQLANGLDADWHRFLALPPEVYLLNGVPNPELIQQAMVRYEELSRQPEFAAITARAEFQETLKSLRKLDELQRAANQPPPLPSPPK